MKIQCNYCWPLEGIDVPEFAYSDKIRIIEMKRESALHTVKFLMEEVGFSHLEAKYIIAHINAICGKCNKCSGDLPDLENVHCPSCEAFNFNWKEIHT